MKTAIVLALLSAAGSSFAHQLDGYLEATTISLGRTRVWAYVRLTPGINAFSQIIRGIDLDRDGIISPKEQKAYAAKVLHDLSFSVDGHVLKLRLLSYKYPEVDAMKKGVGDIALSVEADVPAGESDRKLVFENRHQRSIASYLVNCLAPEDDDFKVTSQTRNLSQSRYELTYIATRTAGPPLSGAAPFRAVLSEGATPASGGPAVRSQRRLADAERF